MEDEYSAAEYGNFSVEDEYSATEYNNFSVEYEYSATEYGNFFVEHDNSAAEYDNFSVEYGNSTAEYGNFSVEHDNSAAEYGNSVVEYGNSTAEYDDSGKKSTDWRAAPSARETPTQASEPKEGGLMALWSDGSTWSSGKLWGPSSPTGSASGNHRKHKPKMKRQPYYPKTQGQQSEWHTNFATKLPGYAAELSLSPAEVDQAVADNLILAYALGGWIVGQRDHATACTSSLEKLNYGTGQSNFVFPVVQTPPLPTLPTGITGVKPGALQRTFDLAGILKRKGGYTPDIGLDLGIVGPEAPPPPPPGDATPPRISVSAIPGDNHDIARLKFFKDGHEYVVLESRRGTGGWESLGQLNKSPYDDDRPLLVPGQAEVREYRARFWDNGANSSGWCDVTKVTVGP